MRIIGAQTDISSDRDEVSDRPAPKVLLHAAPARVRPRCLLEVSRSVQFFSCSLHEEAHACFVQTMDESKIQELTQLSKTVSELVDELGDEGGVDMSIFTDVFTAGYQ